MPLSSDSFRKIIFEGEFLNIKHQNNISDTNYDAIKYLLFEHPFDPQPHRILKSEINSFSVLEKVIKEDTVASKYSGDILTLFLINADLSIPDKIKYKLLKNDKVAVFVGAGVSKLLKLPLWNELANNAMQYLFEKGYINHFESDSFMVQRWSLFRCCYKDSVEAIS